MNLPKPELRRARIEIVPMIDTIFFLLVFFMITSLSMVALKSKKVVLPESETAKLRPRDQTTLTVDKQGAYYINKDKTDPADIPAKLELVILANPETQVVLNCDKDLPVTYFLRAFDLAKRSNAAHILVATAPRGLRMAQP